MPVNEKHGAEVIVGSSVKTLKGKKITAGWVSIVSEDSKSHQLVDSGYFK